VFRSLRLLFGALRLLFGAPRRLFGTLPCQREVCLHLSQLSGDRRQLRRLGIEIATIDVEAWREIRRFAIRCHRNEIGRSRQTDAGLEMRVAAPVEYQRRRRRAGVGEQRRADQRTLLHEPDVAERALQQRAEFASAQLAHMKRIRRRAGRGINVAIGCACDEAAVGAQHPADLAQEILLPVEVLDCFE
jgi:hypothetical protein